MEDNGFLLKVNDLYTGYNEKTVVRGVSLNVLHGETVAIIGHNGAGKSTLMKAIFGIRPMWGGSVSMQGVSYHQISPSKSLKNGVVYVPQGNRIFENLTVEENLNVSASTIQDQNLRKERIQSALDLFPDLRDRLSQRAGTLSGGERQMLALCSARILDPCLLLLDEPSLGLAPQMASKIMSEIEQISESEGVGVVVVEHRVEDVLQIANRVYVLEHGAISFSGNAKKLKDKGMLRELYL